jgi:hypothetical protein
MQPFMAAKLHSATSCTQSTVLKPVLKPFIDLDVSNPYQVLLIQVAT